LGYQQGFVSNLWQIGANLAGLGGLLFAVAARARLPWLVLAVSGLPVTVTALNWLHYFGVSMPALWPRFRFFQWRTGCLLAKTGFIFMILSVLSLTWFHIDSLIIAQILGASAVTEYAVAQRLFAITMVAQFFILPLWPAYGEAIARSDYHWARKTLNRGMLWSLVITLGLSLPIVIFGQRIIIFWLRAEVVPSSSLMCALTALNLLVVTAGNLSSLLVHGANLRKQLLFYAAAALAALILKMVLTANWGLPGVVWASVFAFGVIYTPLALHLAYTSLRTKATVTT
jgi:O-antigen/teichoic acid export membrane protein